ncbi:ABC transporter permease [Cecembia lonarensis]|uniref:Macrolide export ATP-binding/permease protein MacB n=1 Tax=Cecembia lonarensis (strain CCUG 58316 / KCTC 22772 / LW9) TaxID=1225176 RepID=K1KYE3_CECL9|nr:ABC transporter permease [Cecembia lonarensis]EKB47531.1 Macrolide export ATP-binding/permease protein MacB [Cecembia lonarensis LW9]
MKVENFERKRLRANFHIAFEAVVANKVRSLLTALGIIFGVAAVIAMLAIGNGAQQEILEQIKLVGVNNIVVEPVTEQRDERVDEGSDLEEERARFSPGLKLQDVEAIQQTIPGIKNISPEIEVETFLVQSGVRRSAKLVGITPAYFEVLDFQLLEGRMFSEENMRNGEPVCIIGKAVANKFFPKENPLGKRIKSGSQWLEIIGIMEERYVSEQSISKLGIRDFNMDVYIPIQTMLVRFKNRDLVLASNLEDNNNRRSDNYHQLDKIVIQVEESDALNPTAEVVTKLLERRHNRVIDFEVTIPELLLKQQQRTQNIFNIVLGAIAGISLLVGGIGIMNIMLASVLERIKEIGLRLSLGAKKSDIVNQFLFEAVMISVSGGLIGVILGIILAQLVARFGDFPTVITLPSILLSFGVAATVGLIFGIAPARKAASQDPITSLRYE